jgi:hypothetical protein
MIFDVCESMFVDLLVGGFFVECFFYFPFRIAITICFIFFNKIACVK